VLRGYGRPIADWAELHFEPVLFIEVAGRARHRLLWLRMGAVN